MARGRFRARRRSKNKGCVWRAGALRRVGAQALRARYLADSDLIDQLEGICSTHFSTY